MGGISYSLSVKMEKTVMWSFSRIRDASKIEYKDIYWEGPFSWTGYDTHNDLMVIPDIEGIYLWTFCYKDGYLVLGVK